jgi:hypothetical protein
MRSQSRLGLVDWPIGTRVRMVDCYDAKQNPNRIWVTRSKPWVIGGHTQVVLLQGKSGGFDTACLEVVK